MVPSAVIAVIGTSLLTLGASHPVPDYKRISHTDVRLQAPYLHLPLFPNYDNTSLQTKQAGAFLTTLGPLVAALLAPFFTTVANGIGSTLTNGLSTTSNTANRTAGDVEAVVVNVPGSSLPYVYLTQIRDNSGAQPLLSPASPLVPPFVTPVAIPLPYAPLIRGNVLSSQPIFSGDQLVVSYLSHPEGTKDDAKSVTEHSAAADEPSDRSEVTETP